MTAALVRGDALAIPLRDASVDLVVTSPPYFALRSYQDDGEHYAGQIGSEPTPADFLHALWSVTRECVRVLKPGGSIFVNLGDKYSQRVATRPSSHHDGLFPDRPELRKDWKRDKEAGLTRMPNDNVMPNGAPVREKSLMGLPWRYAIGCIDNLGLILRAEIVWSKPNGLPESVTDRVRRSHEQWFHLTREPRYYSAVDEVREPHAPGTAERYAAGYGDRSATNAERTVGYDLGGDDWQLNPLGKLPGSVWTVPSEPLRVPEWLDVEHFAAFPQEWPRRLILGWSPPGWCTRCGEARRPVSDVAYGNFANGNDPGHRRRSQHGVMSFASGVRAERTTTITGYACSCPDTTAPTTPAVVLDPFGGTGTTVMVARALGRTGISLDLSADYLRLARWRVFDSGHHRKSVRKSWEDRQGGLGL